MYCAIATVVADGRENSNCVNREAVSNPVTCCCDPLLGSRAVAVCSYSFAGVCTAGSDVKSSDSDLS